MGDHIQIRFTDIQPEQQEWVVAHLAEAGYEGFEETENELKAFIPAAAYDAPLVKELAYKYQLHYDETVIAEQNWNAVWESNFQPVIVDDFVAVRAGFHEPVDTVEQEIIITPKMSFGTGHHATTYMMMQEMRKISFHNKTVFDFGTGTGVLAILAERLGAREIVAVDIDPWSIENAAENIAGNNCSSIMIRQADSAKTGRSFDVILANINKNVILDNMLVLSQQLEKSGIILFSGLLLADEEDIVAEAEKCGLKPDNRAEKDNWLCLRFIA
jgi:ribosomal protein L11 methyltransferase